MENFEHATMTQEAIDQQVVAQTIADIEAHLQVTEAAEWQEAYWRNGAYIDALYDEFAPDISETARMTGKLLGAAGLAWVEKHYGKDEYSAKLYGGSYEQCVLATYHHANHSRTFIRDMFRYAQKVNESESDTYGEAAFARFPVIGAFHDAVMGNGRGNDERQSALLATELMSRLGFAFTTDEETLAGIIATTWSPELSTQSVDADKPYLLYQRAAAIADLLPLFDRRGPYQSMCVIIEDMCKRMHDQLFTVEADAAGFSLVGASIEDCMRLVDSSPDLRAKFAKMLVGQAGFFEDFTPADPRLDALFPGRAENVVFLQELSANYNARDISALGILRAARNFMTAA